MKTTLPPATVHCQVHQLAYGPWIITFKAHLDISLYLQSDVDRASFAVSAGAVTAPPGWNGEVQSLGLAWQKFDPEAIAFCPEEYFDLALRECSHK